jgi:hypothetical protein
MKRLAMLGSIVSLLTLTIATPVLAAAPTNDLYPGRTVIAGLPFSDTVDTTEATTDADDAEANVICEAPATDASVWYELTATADEFLVINVSASDYTAGVIVVTGSPGSFELVTCGPDAVILPTLVGETYAILAFDDQFDGGGNGGTLQISIDAAPPPPEIDVTVDPTGQFNAQTGSATVSGTVTCSGEADFAFVDVQLRQQVGRFVVDGFGSIEVICDGTTQPWSVEVFPSNGLFKGGRAVALTFAVACGFIDCGTDFEEAIVRLRR